MSVIATGSYTIIDYNDAPLLNGWISVTGSKTQGFTPDSNSYVPDYTQTPLRLTASLFSAGNSSDLLDSPEGIISNMKWKVTDSKGTTNDLVGEVTRNYSVNKNLTDDTSKTYTFCCDYTQPASHLSIPVEISVDINKVINGTGISDAVILAPSGNIFKNNNANKLTAECQLWVGSIVDPMITAANFKWWKMDASGVGGGHGIGAGWTELKNNVNGYLIEFRNLTSIITIPSSDVFSSAVYMCTVQDSCHSNQIYKETIAFLDTTDPIYLQFESTGGNVFKNGKGSTDITAILIQNGVEIDADGTKYTYSWYKYDKNGDIVTPTGKVIPREMKASATPIFVGKKINVTDADVDEKATFKCDIS